MASQKQLMEIPLATGLATKDDPRAMAAPGLAVCEDVQFDELGGIQTRPQFQAITDAAGNTIADIRKIEAYGDELVAFSKDKLWSYASGDGLWTQRAEYLAVKVEEVANFVTTAEQFDCDRATLGGITMYVWTETTPTATLSYVAAIDTATGSVKLTPESLGASVVRPRVTATTNKLIVTFYNGTVLSCKAYTPSTLASVTSSTLTTTGGMYDVMVHDTATKLIGVTNDGTTGYIVFEISEAGLYSSLSTRTVTVDSAMSIAQTPTATDFILVCYSNGTSIRGDLIDFAGTTDTGDIVVGTAANTPIGQISSVWNADDSLFYMFYSCSEVVTSSSTFEMEFNTLNTSASAGTEARVIKRAGMASHAFVHDTSVYVWVVFAGQSTGDLTTQLQNTYFLYRSDGALIAKAVPLSAGGLAPNIGHIPSVESLGSNQWAWVGQHRGIIPLGQEQKGYSAKSPQDVTITFDSDEARRTARLGDTLYITGGQLSQYSGRDVTEVGFHAFPWFLGLGPGAAGNPNGTYNFLQTFSHYNSKGEFERSTTATIASVSPVNQKINVGASPLHITLKQGDAGECAVEFWRQIDAAPVGAPYYLVTSKDPSSTGDNAYLENGTTLPQINVAGMDDLTDALLISRETYPENGGLTLANLPPPPATVIASTQDRLILAGIAANPNRIVYSKLRGKGEVASFSDALYIDLPPDGGKITAIDFLNETMIVFKQSAIYALPGDGFNNNGGGQNYGPSRLLDSDVGAISAEGVVLTPKGLLFKSSKGWFLLNHGWQANYVGRGVDAYDTDTIVACHAMDSQHQVRCVSSNRTLIWDYLIGEWIAWTTTAVDATMWGNVHHLVNSAADGVLAQAATYSGSGDLPGLDIETGWIKMGELQGFKLVRNILILGEYLGAHDLRVRVAYNYNETASGPTWVDDKTWTVSPTTINGPLQVRHGPSRPKCEAIKIRITAQAIGATTHPITQALNLTGLSLEVALKQGAFANLPATQKQ